MTLFQLQQRMT